jgi:hypothetical protein
MEHFMPAQAANKEANAPGAFSPPSPQQQMQRNLTPSAPWFSPTARRQINNASRQRARRPLAKVINQSFTPPAPHETKQASDLHMHLDKNNPAFASGAELHDAGAFKTVHDAAIGNMEYEAGQQAFNPQGTVSLDLTEISKKKIAEKQESDRKMNQTQTSGRATSNNPKVKTPVSHMQGLMQRAKQLGAGHSMGWTGPGYGYAGTL